MAHRTIGQESLAPDGTSRGGATLEPRSSLIDWQPVAALPASLYPSTKGEPASPPLAMFKALLLAVPHDLSDVKPADALESRGSFRRFCGFAAREATPERTTFVRFRRALIARGLDRQSFDAVTALVEQVSVTPANVRDGREGPAALPDASGDVFADRAYRGQQPARRNRRATEKISRISACRAASLPRTVRMSVPFVRRVPAVPSPACVQNRMVSAGM